ncbi:MAG: acetyltransferase [Acidimicrobiales bacterium]
MTPLVLVGAGGFARETAELVRAINRVEPRYELLGYLDDDPALHGQLITGAEVLGSLEAVRALADAKVVVCLGSPTSIGLRRTVVDRLGLDDARVETLVHPAATVSESVSLGAGTVIHAGVVMTADIEVGRHVEVMPGVVMTHDDRVADYATFGAGVRLAGGVTIGEAAYIGSGAMVREGVPIGAGALIGMGSVVTRPVPANEVWAGVPARRLRPVNHGGLEQHDPSCPSHSGCPTEEDTP